MQIFRTKKAAGFTLVEIMIVVLIIGILLAIAIPNFVQARESSRAKACVANLKQIDSAKQQWAMDNKKTGTDTPGSTDLSTTDTTKISYIRTFPSCPETTTAYTIGNMNTLPTCALGTNDGKNTHVLQ